MLAVFKINTIQCTLIFVYIVEIFGYQDVSFQATSQNCLDKYISHEGGLGFIKEFGIGHSSWNLIPGFASGNAYSLESVDHPGKYLRHQNSRLKLHPNDGSQNFKEDSTFRIGPEGYVTVRLESFNFRGNFIRHYNNELYISNGKGSGWDGPGFFQNDTTFLMVLSGTHFQ